MNWDQIIAGILFWGGDFGFIYYQSYRAEIRKWWAEG